MNNNSNRSNRLQIWLPFLVALGIAGGMYVGMRMNTEVPSIQKIEKENKVVLSSGQGRVEEIMRYLDARYVDDVNSEKILDKVITNLMKELDPHSSYIPASELQEVNEQLEGSFDGIGVEYMILDDTIVVVTPLSGGPSEAAGVQVGDKIVTIADSLVAGVGIDNAQIFKKLRGEAGTEVKIGIQRSGSKKLKNYVITRDKIPNKSVDVYTMLDDSIGYIKVNRFSAQTYEEFMEGMDTLAHRGMRNLVIDLRHNPGGYMNEATQILSQLFDEAGMLLVYTEGENVSRTEYDSKGRPFFKLDQIAVLIDEGSASASEILAGAIQDHDRGWIIGRRSYGKGLVQEQYVLRDGSALRLTIARYYTPSGRSIQKDYTDRSEYDSDMFTRFENGELLSQDSIKQTDSTEYYTDLGRKVYGGGGIVPEIFVPLDTVVLDEDYARMRQFIPSFVFKYAESHKEEFKDMPFEEFDKTFHGDGVVWQDYLKFAEEKGEVFIEKNAEDKRVRKELQEYLKARLARLVYGNKAMYDVLNDSDEMIEEALRVIREYKPIVED